jgi:hypothetical protein
MIQPFLFWYTFNQMNSTHLFHTYFLTNSPPSPSLLRKEGA